MAVGIGGLVVVEFVEKPVDALREFGRGDLTLPDGKDAPAETLQRLLDVGVALDISGELRQPVVQIRRWLPAPVAAIVLVPKASVDEHDGAMSREDDVGRARQITAMEAEAVS